MWLGVIIYIASLGYLVLLVQIWHEIPEALNILARGGVNRICEVLFIYSAVLEILWTIHMGLKAFSKNKNKATNILDKTLYTIFINPIIALYAISVIVIAVFNIGGVAAYSETSILVTIGAVVILVILMLLYHCSIKEKCERLISDKEVEFERKERALLFEYRKKDEKLAILKNNIEKREMMVSEIINSKKPFSKCAELYTDFSLVLYNRMEEYLRTKPHPAVKAADSVKLCKAQIKSLELQHKELSYKYEYIITVFPELKDYFAEEEALLQLDNCQSLDSFMDDYDRTKDYLSKEEWMGLPTQKRNQLAFDRWKKASKSNWVIGMLYEMFIAHTLRTSGFIVCDYGIRRGLGDLGRDVIAKKWRKGGGYDTYIIQCKNWSKVREIHENVVCQLFGTTLEYKLSNRDIFGGDVYPLLVTTTDLSDMAKKFAEKLDVKVRKVQFDLDKIPLIKCNINNDNKIYHLPFDQQYWHTYIDKEGEFYAYTVEEAEKKGFRRAYRWSGS